MTCCHACGDISSPIEDVVFGDFDGSLFSRAGVIRHCAACGLGSVDTGLSDDEIAAHYASDCLYAGMTGVGVGGNSPEDTARYAHYAGIVAPFVDEIGGGAGLVDIGCSRGGMLRDLGARHRELPLLGIDLDETSLRTLTEAGVPTKVGSALELPLAEGSQSMLSYLHVFEHIIDTDAVLKEASRVLAEDGLIFIEVPDAAGYGTTGVRVGTMFWLAMKEHVYHFTAASLTAILARNGFSVVRTVHAHLPMRAGKAYPSLIVVARKSGQATAPSLAGRPHTALPDHIRAESEAFAEQARVLAAFAARYDRLAFWGISLEFLNLWARLGVELETSHKIRLFDGNLGKQRLSVGGIAILPPAPPEASEGLVACAYMAAEAITRDAVRLGWQEGDILVLK